MQLTGRAGLDRLVGLTPDERVRSVDGVRAVAIVAVVVGHWLAAAVEVRDGRIDGVSVLGVAAWTHPVTWVFQVMSVLFLAGGFASAASWAGWSSRGGHVAAWAAQRGARLLVPTAVYVAASAAALSVARWWGADSRLVAETGWLLGIGLWFLAVYLASTAATPLLVRLEARTGWWGLWLLAGTVAVGDVAQRSTGVAGMAAGSYVAAWLSFQYLGVLWQRGRLQPQGARWGAAAGLGAAVLLVAGPYPVSMVSVAGGDVQNTTPPSLALVAHGVGLAALAVAAAPALERILRRPAWWRATIVVNAHAMTTYLWHFVPVVVGALLVLAPGWFEQAPVGSAAWVASRPAWLGVLALLLVPLVAVVGAVERRRCPGDPGVRVAWWRPAAAVLIAVPALVQLTTGGLHDGTAAPVVPLLALGAATALVAANTGRRPGSERHGRIELGRNLLRNDRSTAQSRQVPRRSVGGLVRRTRGAGGAHHVGRRPVS